MTRFGVSGHQRVPDRAVAFFLGSLRDLFAHAEPPVTGVSCLAAGADQLFAQQVLASGGGLVAVIPCEGYDTTFDEEGRATYLELLESASEVVSLPFDAPTEEAFMAGGREVVLRSDHLLALWDGRPARGLGGTADVVAFAQDQGVPVTVTWPEGVER